MVVVKRMLVRAYDEVETFHGEALQAVRDNDGVLYIKEKDSETNLGIFNRWDYVRVTETS